MKKVIAMILSLTIVCSMAACGSTSMEGETTDTDTTAETTTETVSYTHLGRLLWRPGIR